MLKPIAGFVLNEAGKVILMAPPENRIVTIVSASNGRGIERLLTCVFDFWFLSVCECLRSANQNVVMNEDS